MLQHFGPIMNAGGAALSLTYIASETVIPGYGGGMSSAKAALESDTRTLAWEAGRKYGIRVNTISAGPLKSRAASAINKKGERGFIDLAIDYSKTNAPLAKDLYSDDIGASAYFLLSPLARAVTGVTLYVDNGLHCMGMAIDSNALDGGLVSPYRHRKGADPPIARARRLSLNLWQHENFRVVPRLCSNLRVFKALGSRPNRLAFFEPRLGSAAWKTMRPAHARYISLRLCVDLLTAFPTLNSSIVEC